jgi:DNA-binding NtrC family response regulator
MPVITLTPDAQQLLINYYWPGNVRQLKNITEQMSILEQSRQVSSETLKEYLPPAPTSNLPAIIRDGKRGGEYTDRELLYKVLFDMKKDVNDLKRLVGDIIHGNVDDEWRHRYPNVLTPSDENQSIILSPSEKSDNQTTRHPITPHEEVEEVLSLAEKEKEMIEKALKKYKGHRRQAAKELGISERTLYRKMTDLKIKE